MVYGHDTVYGAKLPRATIPLPPPRSIFHDAIVMQFQAAIFETRSSSAIATKARVSDERIILDHVHCYWAVNDESSLQWWHFFYSCGGPLFGFQFVEGVPFQSCLQGSTQIPHRMWVHFPFWKLYLELSIYFFKGMQLHQYGIVCFLKIELFFWKCNLATK